MDTSHGIITGVDCYPANQRESDMILEHLKGQPCKYQGIGLDGGYDIGAVHRGLELLGVQGYTAIREYPNNARKIGTVRINASAYYPSFYRNSKKVGTSDYMKVMRLRKIWAEGTFAVLKREHKLNKIQKRGLQKATEECLLSATALNLKRLVKAV